MKRQYSFEKTAEIEATLTPNEMDRANAQRDAVRLGLARQYPKLPQILVDAIVRDCIADKTLYMSIVGADGGPSTSADYDEIARELVLSDELAVNAVNLADETAIREARDAALRDIAPARRMAMQRAGTLDLHLDTVAKQAVQTAASAARAQISEADLRRAS